MDADTAALVSERWPDTCGDDEVIAFSETEAARQHAVKAVIDGATNVRVWRLDYAVNRAAEIVKEAQ